MFSQFSLLLLSLAFLLHESPVTCDDPIIEIECVLSKQQFYDYNWHCEPECKVADTGNDIPLPLTGQLEGKTIWYFEGNENYTNQAIYKNVTGEYGYDNVWFYMEYYNGVQPGHNSEMYVLPCDGDYIEFLPSSTSYKWSSLLVQADSYFIQNGYLFESGVFRTMPGEIMCIRQLAMIYGGKTTEEHIKQYCTELEEALTEGPSSTVDYDPDVTSDWSSTTEPSSPSSSVTQNPTESTTITTVAVSVSTESSESTINPDESTINPDESTSESSSTEPESTTEAPYSGSECLADVDSFSQFWGYHPKVGVWNEFDDLHDMPMDDDDPSAKVWCIKGGDSPGYLYHNLSMWWDHKGLALNDIWEMSIYLKHYLYVPGSYCSFYPTIIQNVRDVQRRVFLNPSTNGVWSEDVINVSLLNAKTYQVEGTTNFMPEGSYWCFKKIVLFVNRQIMEEEVDTCQ